MIDHWVERSEDDFAVFSGDRTELARTKRKRDAALVRQALSTLDSMAHHFPGLIDGETQVNGGDLVDYFNTALAEFKTLKDYLSGEGGLGEDEEIFISEGDADTADDDDPERAAPSELWVREAWGRLADDMRAGKVVKVDVAPFYARQGSHWIRYVRAPGKSTVEAPPTGGEGGG